MARLRVRNVTSADFATLEELERDVFGAMGQAMLCPHYLRLCCEVFADSCFVVDDDGRAAGYLLCMVRDDRREAFCATLAVRAPYRRGRATAMLIGACARAIEARVDSCWFTVAPDDLAARLLHKMLGASDVARRPEFYGRGEDRIVSRIDRAGFDRLRERFARFETLIDHASDLPEAA